jgi:hypothetical protein
VDDGEKIAAETVHVRLDQAHDRVCRDGGVHGMSSALEHLDAGARCERLSRGDDAKFRGDFRPARDNIHAARKYYGEES